MQNKPVALVTGANQGIGLQIAKDLTAHGKGSLSGGSQSASGPRNFVMVMKDGEIFKTSQTIFSSRGIIRSIGGGGPLVEPGVKKISPKEPMNSRTG